MIQGKVGEISAAGTRWPAPSIKNLLKSRMLSYVGLLKQSKLAASSTADSKGLYDKIEQDFSCPPGKGLAAPICDLRAQDGNGALKPELTSNVRGESCGDYTRIELKVNGTNVDVTVNMQAPYGAWETSHIEGARVQALKCISAEVLTQLENLANHKITFKDPTALSIARELESRIAELGEYYKLKSSGGKGTVLNCVWNQQQVQQRDTNEEDPAAWSSYVCGNQLTIATVFAQALTVEIFSRYQAAYYQTLVGAEIAPKLSTFGDSTAAYCKAKKDATHPDSCGDLTDVTAGQACANTCYQNRVKPFLEQLFDAKWPLPECEEADKGAGACWPSISKGACQ